MNKIKNSIAVVITLIAIMALQQSCKKNNDKVDFNSDKTKLNKEIDSLTLIYNAAVEGKQAGDGAHDTNSQGSDNVRRQQEQDVPA